MKEPRAICHGCGAEQEYGRIRCLECGQPLVFPTSFTCPHCKAESFNSNDIVEGYCGRCHAFTGCGSDPGSAASATSTRCEKKGPAAAGPKVARGIKD